MLYAQHSLRLRFYSLFSQMGFILLLFSFSVRARCWMGVPFCPRIVKSVADSSIATVYCHGYEDSYTQHKRYLSKYNKHLDVDLLPGIVVAFDFEDAGKNPFRINRTCGCMAQQKEIDRVHAAIMYAHTLDVDMILLFGVSRGASAIIGALGQYADQYPKVVGAVLESPFASLLDVIQHIQEQIGITVSDWFARSVIHLLCAREWDPSASHPIDFTPHIPEHIILQFIASESDHLVPFWSTSKLVEKARNNGCMVFYNCIAQGRHGRIILGNAAPEYTWILQSFFQVSLGSSS